MGHLSQNVLINLIHYGKTFDGLTNLIECTCKAATKYNDHAKLMKLMQFLSGLDDSFN